MNEVENPTVLETHGGLGKIFDACYSKLNGVTFEINPRKAEYLARRRPEWIVFQSDCMDGIRPELINHMPLKFNFIDIDPYGDPWEIIGAIFSRGCSFKNRIGVCVNDGLRLRLKRSQAWQTKTMLEKLEKYGESKIYREYKKLAHELFTEKAAIAGYQIKKWTSYYCGHLDQMTHYAAILSR